MHRRRRTDNGIKENKEDSRGHEQTDMKRRADKRHKRLLTAASTVHVQLDSSLHQMLTNSTLRGIADSMDNLQIDRRGQEE